MGYILTIQTEKGRKDFKSDSIWQLHNLRTSIKKNPELKVISVSPIIKESSFNEIRFANINFFNNKKREKS